MPLQLKYGKRPIIALTIIAVIVLPYTQYRSYLDTAMVTRRQLELNSLRSKILFFDEALSLASRTYVLTGDVDLNNYYSALRDSFNTAILQIDKELPHGYDGKQELMKLHTGILNINDQAFSLLRSGNSEAARKLLESQSYALIQREFSTAKSKLITRLDEENEKLFAFLRAEAINNIILRAAIVLAVLVSWLWLAGKSRRLKNKLKKLEEQRSLEEREAAKKIENINTQLRQLSTYLQDVREKERLFLATEINEQLGQQIVAMKLKIAEVKRLHNQFEETWQKELEDIATQFDEILGQIRNLATEVYPLILRDLGLAEAIQWESERVTSQSGTKVNFTTHDEEVELDHRTTTTLFRTYQQKIQSCLKHGAKEINSTLHVGKDVVFLSISDDGKPVLADGNDIMEDIALRERLQSIKGHCETDHSTGSRNRFTVTVPHETGVRI
jgi:signal transduction histidine kinase